MPYDWEANAVRWDKFFIGAIRKVQQQVHPALVIDDEALATAHLHIMLVMSHLCSTPCKNVDDMRERVDAFLPEDLSRWAMAEADQAVKDTNKAKKKSSCNVVFPVDKTHSKLTKEVWEGVKPDLDVSVYLNAVLEYVCADVLKLAGNYTDNCQRRTINKHDFNVAISADKVLEKLFQPLALPCQKKILEFKYYEIIKDLMVVEVKYLHELDIIIRIFLETMEAASNIFSESMLSAIFNNIRELHEFQKGFIRNLEDAVEDETPLPNNDKIPALGTQFEDMAEDMEFEVYSEYCNGYPRTLETLQQLLRDRAVVQFLDSKGLRYAFQYVLPQLLVEPCYHIFHYFQVLRVLLKITPNSHMEAGHITEALSALSMLETELKRDCEAFLPKRRNDSDLKHYTVLGVPLDDNHPANYYKKSKALLNQQRRHAFQDLQRRIEGFEGTDIAKVANDLLKDGLLGRLTIKGTVSRGSKEKDRYVFLFDTLIICCKREPNKPDFQFKERMSTIGMTVRDIPDSNDELKYMFEVTSTEERKTFTFMARSAQEKHDWLCMLYPLSSQGMGILNKMLSNLTETEECEPVMELDPSRYVFAEVDSESNIVFEPPDTASIAAGGPPQIKGGTLFKLVERLTFPQYADTNYLKQFLLTYRSFCTPLEFLDLLILRYKVPSPENATPDAMRRFKKNFVIPIRLRVFNVLRNWIDKHYYDFEENSNLLKQFLEFIKDSMSTEKTMDKAVSSLTKTIRKHREKSENMKRAADSRDPVFSAAPPPIDWHDERNPAGFDILTLHPREIARQLTLIESDLYRKIRPNELQGLAWSKDKKELHSPNALAMIHRFNMVSSWVATSIVETSNVKERVEVLIRFLDVAEHCRSLNNFNGMMEILSGVQSTSCYRLKHTWSEITPKKKDRFDEFVSLMSRDGNFKQFRATLHSINPPCIPYFGMYLTDLTFIEDGNKDFLGDTKLINFTKRKRSAVVISEIQQYQQTPYNLEHEAQIKEFLCSLRTLPEEECFKLSQHIEPRNADKPTDAPASRRSMLAKYALENPVRRTSTPRVLKSATSPIVRMPSEEISAAPPLPQKRNNSSPAIPPRRSSSHNVTLPFSSPGLPPRRVTTMDFNCAPPPLPSKVSVIANANQQSASPPLPPKKKH